MNRISNNGKWTIMTNNTCPSPKKPHLKNQPTKQQKRKDQNKNHFDRVTKRFWLLMSLLGRNMHVKTNLCSNDLFPPWKKRNSNFSTLLYQAGEGGGEVGGGAMYKGGAVNSLTLTVKKRKEDRKKERTNGDQSFTLTHFKNKGYSFDR